jgi:hypothetical protein
MKTTMIYSTFVVLMLSACTPEISKESKTSLQNLRTSYEEILNSLPDLGSEFEIIPTVPISNLGQVNGWDDLSIPVIEEKHLSKIINEEKVDDNEITWISSAKTGWNTFDSNPFQRDGYYRAVDHDEDVAFFDGAKHLIVFRTIDLDKGEIKGEQIIRGSSYYGWFWLIDMTTKEIIGAKEMNAEYIDELIISEKGSDVLGNRLRNKIFGYIVFYLNEWNSTEGIEYL